MRILIVEDDIKISAHLQKSLVEVGHDCECAADGSLGLKMAQNKQYDVLLIDRMLPAIDGLKLIRSLRAEGNLSPVLILSALGDVDDRVLGLRSGGDDYLVKPFAFAELLARIEVLGRRSNQASAAQKTVLRAGELEMDLLSRKVKIAGEEIDLQTREFRLLEYLLQCKGKLVTRAMLLEAVWDYHFDPQTGVIDVHISRLRKKLSDTNNKIIKTVRGAGYIIEENN